MKTLPPVLSDIPALLALAGSLALAVSFLDSQHPVVVILGSLRLHLVVIVLVMAVLLLLLHRRLTGLFYIFVSVLVLVHMVSTLAPHTATPKAEGNGTALKVMSFNLLGWNWENGERIARFIEDERPDIAFIQEGQPLKPYLDRLKKTYPYQLGCGTVIRRCDSLLLSRFKLSAPDYYLDEARAPTRFFIVTTTVADQKIALAGLHLTKAEIGTWQEAEYRRAAERIAGIDMPVIAAGDFNTASWSPRFVTFLDASGLKRKALEPATWPTGLGPFDALGFPIDHILVNGIGLESLEAFPDSLGSNHRGLIAKLVLPAKD